MPSLNTPDPSCSMRPTASEQLICGLPRKPVRHAMEAINPSPRDREILQPIRTMPVPGNLRH